MCIQLSFFMGNKIVNNDIWFVPVVKFNEMIKINISGSIIEKNHPFVHSWDSFLFTVIEKTFWKFYN